MSALDEWGAYTRNKGSLKSIPGVTGVGLGGPEVIAYVAKVTPEILRELPEDVEGIPLKVKEIGTLRTLPLATSQLGRLQFYRPAPGGVSVGHMMGDTGTHGCAVKYAGDLVGLSNNHVVGLNWGTMREGREGDTILQPGLMDLSAPGTELGELLRYHPVPLLGSGTSSIDAAIYSGDVDENVLGIGVPGPAIPIEAGMVVAKSGRTTGFTTNRIETVGATVDIEGFGEARFENAAITETGFSRGGDSGSLVVDEYARSLGLVFAGSDRATVICEAVEIERLLGVTFGLGDPHALSLSYNPSSVAQWVPVAVGGIMCLLYARSKP